MLLSYQLLKLTPHPRFGELGEVVFWEVFGDEGLEVWEGLNFYCLEGLVAGFGGFEDVGWEEVLRLSYVKRGGVGGEEKG